MHAGFVRDVGEVAALVVHACIAHDLPVVEREEEVRLQPLRPESPPGAKLLAAEAERLRLVEVGPVPSPDQSRDYGGIVKRRRPVGDRIGQSGWPDSNRRLLRPKRSTLTRLSYTPSLKRAYSVTVRADKFTLGNLSQDQRTIVSA